MDNPLKKLGEEWKKASPKEKLMIVGAVASVAAIALYLHNKTSSSTTGDTGTAGLPTNLNPSAPTGGTPGTGQPVNGSPVFPTQPPDGGNPPVYNPPPPDGGTPYAPPPYQGTGTSASATTLAPAFNAASQVLGGTFGRTSQTQQAHQGYNVPPAGFAAASQVQGGTFGRNATTQGQHRGTIPDTGTYTPPPPPDSPSGTLGHGFAPRIVQPTATTQVYAATRHAAAPVPTSSQQQVVRGKAKAF